MILALGELVDVLHRFADAIGIDVQELQQHESAKKLRYTNTALPVRKLRELDSASIDAMQSKFGRSFAMRCSLEALPVLRIDGDNVATGLDVLQDETDNGTTVNIVLEVDKQVLIESWD